MTRSIVSTDVWGQRNKVVVVSRQITATTTRNSTGDSSEFSAAQQVTAS